jgi:dTDP-4-amino-4,6-dideoxygalactose transaminase
LRESNIRARRYFYPLISDFPMYRSMPSSAPANLPVAHATADQVICLPIYPTLEDAQVDAICKVIAESGVPPKSAAA